MKIRFKVHHRPKGDAENIPTYKAGEVHDLELSYANKYIRLGYAVEAVDEPAPVVEVPAELRVVEIDPETEVHVGEAEAVVVKPGATREFRRNKYRS